MKTFLLFLGDLAALYAALLATLLLRYGGGWYFQLIHYHLAPFTIIFAAWLVVFFIAGLYDLRRLRNNLDFLKTLSLALVANAAVAVIVFYLVPAFGIAPKTNLVIFIVFFAVIETLWRRAWNRATASGEAPNRAILVGTGPAAAEAELMVAESPQLGYAIAGHMSEEDAARAPAALEAFVRENGANTVIVPRELKRKAGLAPALYRLFGAGTAVIDLDSFYELVMRKVPLSEVEETWFLENVEGTARFYDPLKRAFEFAAALALGIVLLPLELLFALLIVATSRGPAIYRQRRTGSRGREFTLYKFRSMRTDAEAATGAQWSGAAAAAAGSAHDPRVTAFGRILRASHLDELPQLWNIVRGDLSFVGPRPERPEIVAKLAAEIPFYNIRHLIKPGVTGWAQINHRADRTLEDVRQKLQYDIYYLKNRSLILDLTTILKTAKSVFVNPK